MARHFTVLAVAALVLALAAPPALGGKRSSISLLLMSSSSSDAAAASGPSFGDQVTFSVSTDAERPQVDARCYQNGVLVYEEWHGFFDGALGGQTFTLGPTRSWSGGSAVCEARLVDWMQNGKDRTLASVAFAVSG